ncbi:hypothetical protein ACPV4V_25035, partial [Vibrio crassostreae]
VRTTLLASGIASSWVSAATVELPPTESRSGWLEGKARILLAWDYNLLINYVEMQSVLDGAEEPLKDHKDNTWHAEVW